MSSRAISLLLALLASAPSLASAEGALAGYAMTTLNGNGGTVTWQSFGGPSGPLELHFAGQPTGLLLNDDGRDGDLVAGDGIASLSLDASGPLSPLSALMTLPGADNWPYLTVAAAPVATPTPSPTPAYDFQPLTDFMDANLGAFDGNVVLAVMREGEMLYLYEAGYTLDSFIGLASATKWLSGAVVLDLIEEGSIGMEDTLEQWLPEFAGEPEGIVTVRQGFSMTSGLYVDGMATGASPEINPFLTLPEASQRIAGNFDPNFRPGAGMAYDGLGMQAVGRLCEVAAGMEWTRIARRRLFDPLDMPTTDYGRFGRNPGVPGGARSTAREYLNFLEMVSAGGVYNGVRILEAQSIEAMFTAETLNLPIYASAFPPGPFYPYGAWNLEYAFGCWVQALNPDTNEAEELCSPGANGTYPWVDRKRNIYGIVLTFVPNLSQVLANEFEILDIVRTVIDGPSPTPRPTNRLPIRPTPAPTFTPTP